MIVKRLLSSGNLNLKTLNLKFLRWTYEKHYQKFVEEISVFLNMSF
jgi:hypothetical protein